MGYENFIEKYSRKFLKEDIFSEEFKKFDDVRIKSKNLAGMIYEISGNDVVVKTIKGLVKTTKDDLEMMPQESYKEQVIPKIAEEASKMFYQGFEIGAVKSRLKDKYPSISVVDINDSVDRAFSDVGSKEESFRERLNNFREEVVYIDKKNGNIRHIIINDKSKLPSGVLDVSKDWNAPQGTVFNYGTDRYFLSSPQFTFRFDEKFKEVKGKNLDNYAYTLMNYVNALRRNGKSNEEILKLFKKDFPNVQASDEQLKRFIKKESYEADTKYKNMSLSDAKNILGDRAKWELQNMKKALSSMRPINSEEEEKKLAAVRVMLKNKESFKEKLTLDDVALQKFGKKYNQLNSEEKRECNYVYSEWSDDDEWVERLDESLKEGYVQITGPFNIPKTKARLQQLCNDFGLQMTSDGRIDFNDNRSLLKREINELLGELKNLGVSYRLIEKYSKKTLKEVIDDENKYTAIPLIDEEEAKKAYELLNSSYKVKTKNNYIYLLDVDWDEKSEEIINELKNNNLKLVEKNKKANEMSYKEISGSLVNKRKSVFEDLKREVDKLGYAIGSEKNLSNRINLISRKLDLLDSLVESYKERLNKLNKK